MVANYPVGTSLPNREINRDLAEYNIPSKKS